VLAQNNTMKFIYSICILFVLSISTLFSKPELDPQQNPVVKLDLELPKGKYIFISYVGDPLWNGHLPIMGISYPKDAPIENKCNISISLFRDKKGRILVHCDQTLSGFEGRDHANNTLYYPIPKKNEYTIGKVFKKTIDAKDVLYSCSIDVGKERAQIRVFLTDDLKKLKKNTDLSIYAVGWDWSFWDVSGYQKMLIQKDAENRDEEAEK
jgi:hypothetical protein